MLESMARWMRFASLVAALAIGESCGLKPPAVPHLDVRLAAAARADSASAQRMSPPVWWVGDPSGEAAPATAGRASR